MALLVKILKNSYYDSVTLMLLSKELLNVQGVDNAMAAMATPMNKELLANAGMSSHEVEEAKQTDLIIAVSASSDAICEDAYKNAMELTKSKAETKGKTEYKLISQVVENEPDTQLAIISIAGQFASLEAMQALKSGLHVMIFSDNVTIEEELKLKQYAHEKGLLVMGPDCGTAIIGGIGLCFANAVARGNIGLVAASGTGLQEVVTLIDRFGGGVSQAIGVGGRDISLEIGGIMMMDALQMLEEDEQTDVIVIVSKPPHPEVKDKITKRVKSFSKKSIVCFIAHLEADDEKILYAKSLEDAARLAVKHANETTVDEYKIEDSVISAAVSKLSDEQQYIRGLFCGGTLASEADYIMNQSLTDVYSNLTKKPKYKIEKPLKSEKHTIIDLGDDYFTGGRAHPMIDPTLRLDRIKQEASDRETAVLLLDFELGVGSHADPVGATIEAIRSAKSIAKSGGRELIIVAYVLGTEGDFQGLSSQIKMLEDEGVIVSPSNLLAVNTAVEIVKRRAK